LFDKLKNSNIIHKNINDILLTLLFSIIYINFFSKIMLDLLILTLLYFSFFFFLSIKSDKNLYFNLFTIKNNSYLNLWKIEDLSIFTNSIYFRIYTYLHIFVKCTFIQTYSPLVISKINYYTTQLNMNNVYIYKNFFLTKYYFIYKINFLPKWYKYSDNIW
jgi:hypothetical protein